MSVLFGVLFRNFFRPYKFFHFVNLLLEYSIKFTYLYFYLLLYPFNYILIFCDLFFLNYCCLTYICLQICTYTSTHIHRHICRYIHICVYTHTFRGWSTKPIYCFPYVHVLKAGPLWLNKLSGDWLLKRNYFPSLSGNWSYVDLL